MACTEYNCCNPECQHIWFANGASECPKCGGKEFTKFYEDRDLDK